MRRCSCASPPETPDDAPRPDLSGAPLRYHSRVRHSDLDWKSIDTVLLDMDGTLLDQRFDNWFWQEHIPSRYAQSKGLSQAAATAIRAVLTERELEIFTRLASGDSNQQIGHDLVLSSNTVSNHIASILRKLHLDNRIQAAVQAVRSGIA